MGFCIFGAMRYFIRCKYNGTRFHGWQSQPGDVPTIQDEIERAMQLLLRSETRITGCGRTDTGVHAMDYVFHFDAELEDESQFLYKLNKVIHQDIVLTEIFLVHDDAHARFDATSRSYIYHLTTERDPFRKETAYYYPYSKELNLEVLNEVASLIKSHKEFEPFCKAGTDVKTKRCDIRESYWNQEGSEYTFHITADRFLRGMIRLIVGVSIFVAEGKIDIQEVKDALDNQSRIKQDWSVPPEGLFLDRILYDYIPNS